jgi:hypothetical protein
MLNNHGSSSPCRNCKKVRKQARPSTLSPVSFIASIPALCTCDPLPCLLSGNGLRTPWCIEPRLRHTLPQFSPRWLAKRHEAPSIQAPAGVLRAWTCTGNRRNTLHLGRRVDIDARHPNVSTQRSPTHTHYQSCNKNLLHVRPTATDQSSPGT